MPAAPRPDPAAVAASRKICTDAGYSVDGVGARLGEGAMAALSRGEPWPAARVLGPATDELAALTALFLLGHRVSWAPWLQPLETLGLIRRDVDDAVAVLELRPYDDAALVVSDLRPASGPVPADHVPGIGAASLQLARAVPRTPVTTAVDLGTGCGIQALHLASHASRVLGTDTSPRALNHAALTLALSGIDAGLVTGDLLDPVPDGVDLLVANPPFVVGPPREALTYRDSGRAGDDVTRELLEGIPERLAPGGVAVLLASWVHRRGEPWTDRVAEWLTHGCDAWAVQRAVVDPAEHTALWLRESGDELGGPVYAAWLDWFDQERIEAVGNGIVVLRKPAIGDDTGPTEVVVQDDDPPMTGERVTAWLEAISWLRGRDDVGVLAGRLRRDPALTLETRAAAGEDGWATEGRWLTGHGVYAEVDDAGATLTAALTGDLPAGVVAELAGAVHGLDVGADPGAVAGGLRALLRAGLLRIPGDHAAG